MAFKRKRLIFCLSLIMLIAFKYIYLVSCNESEPAIHFPTTEWLQGEPDDLGLNNEHISNMTDILNTTINPVEHITVSKRGYLLVEHYGTFSGGNQNFTYYHVVKGIAAILTGIAIDKGILPEVNTSIWTFFNISDIENVNSQKEAIKVQHLLTSTAGFEWDEESVLYGISSNQFNVWRASHDWVKYVLDLPMVANPGTIFRYNSGATHLLNRILAQRINTTIREFATQYLFDPLGISIGDWTTDPDGVHDGASGIHISGRDLAKIGLLLTNNGTWNGQQIISENYVKDIFTDHFNVGYGYQFWLENETINGENVWSCRGVFDAKRMTLLLNHEVVVTITCYGSQPNWTSQLVAGFIVPACTKVTDETTNVYIQFTIISVILLTIFQKRKMRR